MPPLFASLALLQDSPPGAAAWNMALDEALLRQIGPVPVLRIYGWCHAAVSFGCFERYREVAESHAGRVPVRRWTGGGVVLHGEDFTYSLIIPASHALAKMRALESYGAIHAAVVAALAQAAGVRALLTAAAAPKVSAACFENAVERDVLAGGRKIAGAAQRRTRDGLLHQGSIQIGQMPAGFGSALAAAFAAETAPLALSPQVLAAARELAAAKYATREWLEKY